MVGGQKGPDREVRDIGPGRDLRRRQIPPRDPDLDPHSAGCLRAHPPTTPPPPLGKLVVADSLMMLDGFTLQMVDKVQSGKMISFVLLSSGTFICQHRILNDFLTSDQ